MSAGYYREDLVPPEWRGKRWEQLAPNTDSGKILSPFPPATIGNPAEDVEAFGDFRAYHGLRVYRECPDLHCEACRIRFATVVCAGTSGCKSARVEYPDGADRHLYHCLTCGRRWSARRLCGPCQPAATAATSTLRELERV